MCGLANQYVITFAMLLFTVLVFVIVNSVEMKSAKPHIVVIVADDVVSSLNAFAARYVKGECFRGGTMF